MEIGLLIKDLMAQIGSFKLFIEELSVYRGEIVSVIGPNGSGKTTLLKTIAGLLKPLQGEIHINGELVYKSHRNKVLINIPPEKRVVGYLPQNYLLFPHMTVWDNIAYPLRAHGSDKRIIEERVQELIDLLNLRGLEKKRVNELSGGQAQRVALARALASKPKILLLDEPFSNIDQESRESIRRWLKEIIENIRITTLIVSHDPSDRILSNRVIYMRNGIIINIE